MLPPRIRSCRSSTTNSANSPPQRWRAKLRVKPQPEFAAHALGRIGGTAATALLIGDSPFDVQAAHNGGFACWCVTTGTHDAAQLGAAGAEAVFADLFAVEAALANA